MLPSPPPKHETQPQRTVVEASLEHRFVGSLDAVETERVTALDEAVLIEGDEVTIG